MKSKFNQGMMLILTLAIFAGCTKTEKSGYGNYIIGVSNSSSKGYNIQVFLDGSSKGSFNVIATQTGNYTALCGDLVHASTLDNVFILTLVPNGKHTVELKDLSTGFVYSSSDFTMEVDGCISQQFNF